MLKKKKKKNTETLSFSRWWWRWRWRLNTQRCFGYRRGVWIIVATLRPPVREKEMRETETEKGRARTWGVKFSRLSEWRQGRERGWTTACSSCKCCITKPINVPCFDCVCVRLFIIAGISVYKYQDSASSWHSCTQHQINAYWFFFLPLPIFFILSVLLKKPVKDFFLLLPSLLEYEKKKWLHILSFCFCLQNLLHFLSLLCKLNQLKSIISI